MRLPLFPLQSVFFPGERIPLHIFESRYLQLIHDCKKDAVSFGIPVFLDKLMPYGVEVALDEIVKLYSNGEIDIVCKAINVIKLNSFETKMPDKLYAGGDVTILENIDNSVLEDKQIVIEKLEELYELMAIPFVKTTGENFNSYTLAHKMGLSKMQEYQLLQIVEERKRLNFIEKHLDEVVKVLKEVDRTKETINFNGHFKNFDPLDFTDFKF